MDDWSDFVFVVCMRVIITIWMLFVSVFGLQLLLFLLRSVCSLIRKPVPRPQSPPKEEPKEEPFIIPEGTYKVAKFNSEGAITTGGGWDGYNVSPTDYS